MQCALCSEGVLMTLLAFLSYAIDNPQTAAVEAARYMQLPWKSSLPCLGRLEGKQTLHRQHGSSYKLGLMMGLTGGNTIKWFASTRPTMSGRALAISKSQRALPGSQVSGGHHGRP
jgi:hypothetical protein